MRGQYILNDHGEPEPCHDLMTWAKWLQGATRQVAQEFVGNGVRVSTVFLGLDHARFDVVVPVLFETRVFGGPLDGEQDRYTTRADAVAGHAAMLARVKETV